MSLSTAMKKIFRHLKNKFVIAILVIAALIASFVAYKKLTAPPNFDAITAKIGDVVETVSVTGVISPVAKAELAFEKSGVLSRVYVKVGDAVKKGQLIAALSGGSERAALDAARATLADMSRALTMEEQAVQKASLASAEASFDDAKKEALNSAYGAYIKAQGALANHTDAFFTYPQSGNPTIILATESQTQESNIKAGRIRSSDALAKWSSAIFSSAPADAEELISKSKDYLTIIKSFMSDLSVIVNKLNSGGSGLSQTQIDTYTAAMNSGLSALDSAISVIESARSSLSSTKNNLSEAQSSYNLKLAGSSAESIAAQAAKVAQAEAAVNEGIIIAPIDGIVTKADPNQGEFVSAGLAGFAVQNSNFKIEAFVPEADIAKLSVGNIAGGTLDAYGADADFPAEVLTINPAETVLEGVPTYKVTLQFINPDIRIRSGMTANLTIFTHEARGVLSVPYRAIVDKDGAKSVRKVNPDGKSFAEVSVTLGLKGSLGNIQIISGLEEGDRVVTYIKQ